MKRFCSIISCFLAITILISSSVVTVHAASVSPFTAPFWVWAGNKAQEEATSDEGYVGYLDYLKAAFSRKDSGCTSSQSKNGCHYWQLISDLPVSSITGKFRVKCQYCGMYYADYSSCDSEKEAETAYSNNVSTLPATGYNSAGKLLWQPRWSDCLENRFGFNVCYGGAGTLWIQQGVENPFVCDVSKDNLSAIFFDSEFLISRSGPDTISGWTQFKECDLIFRRTSPASCIWMMITAWSIPQKTAFPFSVISSAGSGQTSLTVRLRPPTSQNWTGCSMILRR